MLRRPEGVGRITRFRHDFSKPKGAKHGTCFCRHGTILIEEGAIAIQTRWRSENHHGAGIGSKPVVQHRGTILIGARNLSRYRSLLACSCAYPGATNMINFLESREPRKNRDKFINTTVRVRFSKQISLV